MTRPGRSGRARRDGARGQTLVEFALAITVFLLLIMGIIDLARLVYQYNGVAEAARALAREASVHPGSTLGGSSEVAAVLSTQQSLIPGIGSPTWSCVDIGGTTKAGTCQPGDWVKVTISSAFLPITPVANLLGTITLTSAASVRIE